MKHGIQNRIIPVVLALLVVALGVLVAGRIRAAKSVTAPDPAGASAGAMGDVQDGTDAGGNIGSAESGTAGATGDGAVDESASGAESGTVAAEAAPTPTPSPIPTPRPLRELSICEDNLDESLFREATEKGRVELVQYRSEDRVSGGDVEVMKDLAVYLPYGYDESKPCDVLILLHCAWADHRFWLVQNREYRTLSSNPDPSLFANWTQNDGAPADGVIPVYVPNMLDRMIEEGWCAPLIVVSPCVYLYDHQPSAAGTQYDYVQFSREFGTDFLPYLAENYATYAADGSREAIAAAREHFGVLGASFGAYAEYLSVIGDNYDLVAWYTFCGGGVIDPGYLMQAWQEHGTESLPLKLLYLSEGEFDDRYAPESSLQNLLYYGQNVGGPFTEKNVRYTMIRGWGHEDHSYLVGLFNALQLYFKEDGLPHQ